MAFLLIGQFLGSLLVTSVLGFSVSSNFWIRFVYQDKRYHSGLWNICNKEGRCELYADFIPGENDPLWLQQVRMMLIAACITAAISLLLSLLRLYNEKIRGYFPPLFHFSSSALTAVCCWLFSERKSFHNEHYFEDAKYEWGFIVACTSSGLALLFFISGVIIDVLSCTKSEEGRYETVSYV